MVLLILVVLGVHGCQVSATNSALRDYSDNVSALAQDSNQTGQAFFTLLSSGQGSSNATSFQEQIDEASLHAKDQLGRGQSLSVPDQMKSAQTRLVLALQMRSDGIGSIAREVQSAFQPATSTGAVNSIAAEMAKFYASDVLYKEYSLPAISSALHAAGIAVGGTSGQQFYEGQFLPNLQWLTPAYVATQLRATTTSSSGKCSGLHGHSLNSVSVGGAILQTGATNTIPSSPRPTFSLNITNGGNFTQTNVILKVTLSGSSISGQTALAQTTAGQTTTGQVTLNGSPPPGNYTVTAAVASVPCETNTSNNTLTFPVTFQ